jgi:hypothetical protein
MPGTAENRLEQETLARFGFTSGIEWEYHSGPPPFAVGKTWAGSDDEARSRVKELLIRLVSATVSRGAGRLVVQGRLSDIGPRPSIVVIEVFTGERPDQA